ncbi:MAG TPA: nickel-dependent hydrogenase large subunit [Vicinamibacterales bacterium]|nr:nickel-dependent hydrogenase large subunit [Vicinamibacterales bacterium]
MCFHNLPVTFDADGTPTLASGGWDAAQPPRTPPPPPAPRPGLTPFTVAPVTRVAGAMDFYTEVDLANRTVHDARTSAAAFRGYEVVLRNRDPREAMDISSRACGVCGGVHSTTSSMALDMALPVSPPPLGIVARNIAQGAEFLYDHALQLCLLAGPDFSEAMVSRTEPSLWRRAQTETCRHGDVHGYATVADLMRALNPLSGALYVETFAQTRLGMEIVATMVGNYPHPKTMVPGGINVLLEPGSFRRALALAWDLLDYLKRVIAVYEDLTSFFAEANPDYLRNGERPINLLCFGRYDDVDTYDGSYARLDDWAGRRGIPPGVIIDGELRTTSLRAINLGIEEFVDHSFYEHWSSHTVPSDPAGGPLSPFHPWNKETKPKPSGRNWKERYTWSTAPRWDREVVEAGPIARNWMLALRGRPWADAVHPTGRSIEYTLPADARRGEMRCEWHIPQRLNTLERNRARAQHLGITWWRVVQECEAGLTLLRQGHRRVWSPHQLPDRGIGAGFWEAARGALGHWLLIEGRNIGNYQIITPSSFNASPRDPWGRPGPYEEAAIRTPITEEFRSESEFVGVDVMRAVRSFDPCMPCAVHMHTGGGVVTREVVSCGCGA